MLVVLAGCGSKQGMKVEVPVTPPPAPPSCTAFISWTPPTERIDDEPFTVDEISRYDLFIGLASGDYYRVVGIEDPFLTDWQATALLGGNNWFTMTVTDINGLESDKADEVTRLVDSRCQ
jgi:hypothetical protein